MTGKLPMVDILVVEDSPDDSELTIRAIKQGSKNVNVIHMWNGEDALDFIQSKSSIGVGHLRLIILNLNLPRLDGSELLKKLRNLEITRTTPIVVLTSSEESKKINEAYRLGANSYVIKPTRFEEYIHKVSSVSYYWSVINVWDGNGTTTTKN